MSKGEIEVLKLRINGLWGLMVTTAAVTVLAPVVALLLGDVEDSHHSKLTAVVWLGILVCTYLATLVGFYGAVLRNAIDQSDQ